MIYARYRPRLEPSALKPVLAEPAERAPPQRRYMPIKDQQTLMLSLSQAMDAGLSATAFAGGPGGLLLPPTLRQALSEADAANHSLSELLGKHIRLSAASVAILAAGETQGELPRALQVLARRCDEQRQANRLLFKTLLYPCILVSSSVVIPPLPLIVTDGPIAYVGAIAVPLATIVGLLVFFGVIRPRMDPGGGPRRTMSRVASLIPPLSFISKHHAVANFADTLGASVAAGLPINESLHFAGSASGHHGFSERMPQTVEAVATGSTLTEALSHLPLLSAEDRALIGHGEVVGKLDEVLPRLAEDHQQKARSLTTMTIVIATATLLLWVMIRTVLSILEGWNQYFETIDQQLGIFG